MPVLRYFLSAGTVLLALIFLADAYLPKTAPEANHSDIDRTVIRIHASPTVSAAAATIDTKGFVPPQVPAVAATATTVGVAGGERKLAAAQPDPEAKAEGTTTGTARPEPTQPKTQPRTGQPAGQTAGQATAGQDATQQQARLEPKPERAAVQKKRRVVRAVPRERYAQTGPDYIQFGFWPR